MRFFSFQRKIYPLIVLFVSIFFLVFGLVMARDEYCIYFLLACYVTLFVYGCHRQCLKGLLWFVPVSLLFSFLTYYIYGNDMKSALTMFNRFFALFLSTIIGSSVSSIRMSRCLSSLHFPKSITLGMMISTSFTTVLSTEVKRISKAMKTRGAGIFLNPKVLYRAFLIPFVIRIVNISDTLSLSIETRGFTLQKSNTTIYKKEKLILSDVIFVLLILSYAMVVIIL